MGDPSDIGALTLAVGEMRGQLREMNHNQNNIAQKIDLLTEKALLAPTSAQIESLTKRVDVLEADKDRTEGAKGVFAAILQSRFAAWAAAAIAVVFAAIKGDVIK